MSTALFADAAKRTVRGLLLPFGELSRPTISGHDPIMFSAGTVELPADPMIVTLNTEHSQFEPVGRAVAVTETPKGIEAEFAIAKTPEGDTLMEQTLNPNPADRPRLSAEVKNLVRRGSEAVSAKLTGAAVCAPGAFPSAAMFSAVDDAVEVLEEENAADVIDDAEAETLVDDVVESVLEAIASSDTSDTNAGETMAASARRALAARRPAVVPRSIRRAGSSRRAGDSTSVAGLFAAIAEAKRTGNRSALEPYLAGEAAFAIAPINHAGPSGATIGTDIAEPSYLGQLWKRRKYERRFFNLTNTAALSSFEIVGWQFVEGKEPVMAAYAGNTAEVPSNAVDTEPVKATARRIAGGHRIDRRFVDFPDQGFWEAYFDTMVESYSRVSDLDALSTMVADATTVTPGTVPTGIAPGLAAIVDGALGVIATENTPAFAVVSSELWRDIVLTGRDEVLGYLSAAFGLEEGSMGGFRILPGPVGEGKVLVGAREARTMYELPGSPIRVEGLVPSNGAIDPALYGYIGDVTHNAKALSLVTVATPPAE